MQNPLPDFIAEASGRLGDRVYLKGKNKLASRRYVPPRDPRTAGQQQARARFAQAVRAWAALTEAQRTAWDKYGATRPRTAPTWAQTNMQTGYGAFVGLSLKRLHLQADADLLVGPPQSPFVADTVTVTARAGAGEMVWQASGPNAQGVVTELLAQRMRRVGGLPCPEKYRTLGFALFPEGRLAETTPLAPGLWACAVRFIQTDTGRATALAFLPAVWIPA